MRQKAIGGLLKSAGNWAKRNSPNILVGVGISAMLATVITAVKATPKAVELIKETEEEKGEKLTPKEVIKTTWKLYILPTATFAAGTACIIGSSVENTKRNAALATACSLSETALKTYQEKVIETLGEEKEKEIRNEAQKEIIENQKQTATNVYILSDAPVMCVDPLGRRFVAEINDIKAAVNTVNDQMNKEGYASVNDFYSALDLSWTDMGSDLGWNRDWGLIELRYPRYEPDPDNKNRPMLIVSFNIKPNYDFDK